MLRRGSTITCHCYLLAYKCPLCRQSKGMKKKSESRLRVFVLGQEQDFTLSWEMQGS